MFTLYKRQRRRLNFFAAFAALPCVILIFVSALPLWGLTIGLVSAAVAGLGLMAIPLLILRITPRFRSLCEALVIALVIGSTFQLLTLPLADLPVIGPWRAVVGIVAFALFFYYDLANRLLPLRTYAGTASFSVPQSTYTIWAEHYPDPGLLDRHWSDALHNLEMPRTNPKQRVATYQTSQGEMRQRQIITEETTHASFAYDFTQLLNDNTDGPSGSYALKIVDHGLYRDVIISQQVHHLPIMTWLSTWLDDIVGDECDHHRARGLKVPDFSITGDRQREAPHRLVGPPMPEPLAA